MADGRPLELPIDVDGRRAASSTRLQTNGAYVLSIGTVLPAEDLALELHSTYVGHPGVATHATYLYLGLGAHEPRVEIDVHHELDVDVVFRSRSCLYDHAHRLSEFLQALGHDVRIHVSDCSTAAVEALR